jgi:hypothetical protein
MEVSFGIKKENQNGFIFILRGPFLYCLRDSGPFHWGLWYFTSASYWNIQVSTAATAFVPKDRVLQTLLLKVLSESIFIMSSDRTFHHCEI